MPVLQDILDWSARRPEWQRDALRRIITQEGLSDEDIDELTKLCLAGRELRMGDDTSPQPEPLAERHIPPVAEATDRVQLVGLRNVQHVNALAPGQRVGFELDGMTIIFGYNGTGKSGYARVLRRLCHARGRDAAILPDVFADGESGTPAATVDYRVGDADHSVDWQQGQNPPPELGRVSFFDSDCGAIEVIDGRSGRDAAPGASVPASVAAGSRAVSNNSPAVNVAAWMIRSPTRRRSIVLSRLGTCSSRPQLLHPLL